jgi:hypothetical protein
MGKQKTCKVVEKYASYTTKEIKRGMTPTEAIKLRDELMSKPRKPFVAYDAVWEGN